MPRKTRRKKSVRRGASPGLPGMPSMPGNQQALMKQMEQMQQMQSQMAEEASAKEYEASAGGGMVKVGGTGQGLLTHVEINPEILDPEDAEMVQDMILAAVNDFLTQVQNSQESQMDELTRGLNLPPGLLG